MKTIGQECAEKMVESKYAHEVWKGAIAALIDKEFAERQPSEAELERIASEGLKEIQTLLFAEFSLGAQAKIKSFFRDALRKAAGR